VLATLTCKNKQAAGLVTCHKMNSFRDETRALLNAHGYVRRCKLSADLERQHYDDDKLYFRTKEDFAKKPGDTEET
jgi:hypothetical protein